MNLNSHLTKLQEKHEILSQKIETNQRSPGTDDLETGELKREKLRLKEEIVRVEARI